MKLYVQLLLASFLWGSNVVLMKILIKDIPFLFLATSRVFISLFFIYVYIKYKHISLSYKEVKKSFIIGFFGIYLNFYFTFLGMQNSKGVDNAFINALSPVITFLLSYIILQKKGSIKEWICTCMMLFSFLLSIRFRIFDIRGGIIYLFFGLAIYAFSHILIQKWNLNNSVVFVFYQFLYGFLFLLVHCIFHGQWNLSYFYHLPLVYCVLFFLFSGIGFAFIQIIYLKSIKKIGTLRTSFFLSANPIVTYVGSVIFLHEDIDLVHIVSFTITIITLFVMNYTNKSNIS